MIFFLKSVFHLTEFIVIFIKTTKKNKNKTNQQRKCLICINTSIHSTKLENDIHSFNSRSDENKGIGLKFPNEYVSIMTVHYLHRRQKASELPLASRYLVGEVHELPLESLS